MANIFQKHKNNLKGGEMLLNKHIYDASIHCFYYSSFLLSKYVLCNHHDISYDDQKTMTQGGVDSHNTIIQILNARMRTTVDPKTAETYRRSIYELRTMRTRADYDDSPITKEQAADSQKSAHSIKKLIYANYGIKD